MLRLVSTLPLLTVGTVAASCWRNTTCTGPLSSSFKGPWDDNIYAPGTRSISPRSILSLPGGEAICEYDGNDPFTISSSDGGLVFDFGLEVGGIVTVNYTLHGPNATLGLAFSESKKFIGRNSDNSNGGEGDDGALGTAIHAGRGSYAVPDAKLRGGFRYLTMFLDANSNTTLEIHDIALEISFQPTWSNLRAYGGYFHSSDELLDKIWYAGAYTLQTNSVPATTGRRDVGDVKTGWLNDAVCGPGDSVLLDGAKRDRWVWIGDMGIAVPGAFVSTGDMESTKNALRAILDNQKPSGILPKAGPPYLSADSDTYHLWALIGTYNYFMYTEDVEFLQENWSRYLKAINFTYGKMTSGGIINATDDGDWGRWKYSTLASSPNILFYRALRTGALLASWIDDAEAASDFASKAENLQSAIMDQFWNGDKGAFQDSPDNATLYPQDANSMAVAYGVVSPSSKEAKRVSDYLESNWTPIGPACPELPNNVSPFISSIELEGHFRVGRPDRALELMRTSWGWYLNNPNGTESTVPEGYLVNGTFGYRGDRGYRFDESYVSHAHGWSSGPTSTLTEYLVGLRVTEPRGQEWELVPATFNEVPEFEAGFTTSLGKFSAKFKVNQGKAVVEWDTPKGTRGTVELPGRKPRSVDGGKGRITVNLRD